MFPYDEWEAEQNRLTDPPQLGPVRLRMLLAKRHDAQSELYSYMTELEAVFYEFRLSRELYGESGKDWKLTFRPGDYRLPNQPLDLSDLDLSATCWNGVNLAGTVARGAFWDEAEFTYAWVDGKKIKSDCSEMDFSGWQAGEFERTGRGLSFVDVNLQRSCWNNCLVTDSIFDHCDFRGARLRGASFSWCNLESCDFDDADCTGAGFYACRLPLGGYHPALKAATIRANLSY